jgi:hypothetical protein
MTDIIFINTIPSGLGDRFMDVILYYTYSSFLKYDKMYYIWNKNYSYNCLNINLIKKYLKLPSNLIIDVDINTNNKDIFNVEKYKCGTSSIYSFINYFLKDINIDLYNLFLENKEEEEKFIKLYFDNFKKIKFENIPINISNEILDKKYLLIHLRRTDKVNHNPHRHGTNNLELEQLNKKTTKYILDNKNKYKYICFISDDNRIKNEYLNKFKNEFKIINFEIKSSDQPFIDLYLITKADKIFMSQKFSNFSILGSLICNKELNYPFNYGRLFEYKNIHYNYFKYENLKYFD